MLGTLGGLRGPFQKALHEPKSEGFANRLHYRITVMILFGCSLLVTCLEWVGNGSKISCVLEGNEDDWTIPPNVINTYCFVLKTFTLPKHYNAKIGSDASQVGVGAFNPHTDDVSHKAYYQWVPFVLFFQGVLFYLPHLLFKSWEGGKLRSIISGLHNLILSKDDRLGREKILANYFVESLHTHNMWALKMPFIEFLNLINVVGNIYFVDVFLGGEFSTYGLDVLRFVEADPENRIDPMSTIFPRVTKCSFYKYGPSGTVQTHDAICVLPINSVNEKIYVFLWFWFIIMSVVSVLSLLYHIFLMLTPGVIKVYLKSRTLNQEGLHLDEIGKQCEVGDWKVLYLLGKNMEPVVFGEFLRELFSALKDANDNDAEAKPLMA